MKRFPVILAACILGCFSAAAEDSPPTQLTVLAEEDLTIPLSSIARSYTLKHHVALNLSFDSTAQQVARIEEGEPADVFITADEAALKQLKLQGLLDAYTYSSVAGNRLMLAAAAGSPLRFTLERPDDLLAYLPDGTPPVFAVSDGDLHAEGAHASDVLKMLGLHMTDEVMLPMPLATAEPELASVTVLPDKNAVADLVARGSAYGIMYATETRRFPSIRQAAPLPETMHRPIRYIAVVVAGTEMDAARGFVEFLRSPKAQAIFTADGFFPAEEKKE